MIKFIAKEIFSSILSILIFLLIMFYGINILIPGDFLTPLRLMMSQQELDTLRESLGASDPLYQQYFRWIISVLNGEITPGGFRRNNSRDITTTIFPTIQILLPSFLLSFYIARIPALKTQIKKLHKNKIFTDTFATLLISLFPPIIYYLVSERIENVFVNFLNNLDIEKASIAIQDEIEFFYNISMILFLIGLVLIFIFLIELITLQKFSYFKVSIALGLLISLYVFLDLALLYELVSNSRDAVKTISVLSVFLIGEYILMNSVIIQNISREPHVLTATAIGYSNQKIFNKHILKNSFGPFAARLGLNIPFLIASLVIVESTTGWGGMGSLLYRTILNQDSNAAMGILFLLSLLATSIRVSIAIIQSIIDPRIYSDD